MEGDEQEPEEEGLPGPPPDPSRIPSIVRKVGDLNLQSEAEDHGISKKTDPDIRAIMEFLDEVEELEPLSNNLSGDPMAEAWLQILLTLIVREHGHSSLGVSTIEVLVGERMNREGIDLEIFLDRLWIMGRLEKVYGGAEVSYSPNPSWLEMK
ncbi:MAG: hypothetical protein CL975_00380 [Euryarchaeota archaeon]|jgi:hypothetical protein|nr:hypothetical protein [Euryarchaeota archaeon]|tara:strand:+ start:5289 stop:5747 length:459 start_codon:yes stop_codon:yes gene_type:complete